MSPPPRQGGGARAGLTNGRAESSITVTERALTEEIERAPGSVLSEDSLRRWLAVLRQPDKLALTDIEILLRLHGRMPKSAAPLAVGQAGAELILDAIERLRPPDGADRDAALPHEVLHRSFVEGAKLFQAAAALGLSERQLSRERSRAIRLLLAELENTTRAPTSDYLPEPIPRIRGFLDRPAEIRRIAGALDKERLALVHGAPGIGKTCLVAEVAAQTAHSMPALWYRFRPGVNTSLSAILLELGQFLRALAKPELDDYLEEALPHLDTALATRVLMRSLGETELLLVFDDYHLVEEDRQIAALIEELVQRLPLMRIATVSQHRYVGFTLGKAIEISSLAKTQAQELLSKLGVDCSPEMLKALHTWTDGNPNLLKLAASWLKNEEPEVIAEGIASFKDQAEVQSFLLSHLTTLIDPDDRDILKAASIFRDRFNDDALAYVVQRTRGSVIDSSLRLVRCYAATRNREGDSAFFHNSVKEFVYSRIDPRSRAEMHTRAAEWFERQANEREAAYHRRRGSE